MSKHTRVARNIIALLVNQIGTWSITLVLTLVIPSYLGINLYGLYSFIMSYITLFAIFVTLGTGTYLTWRIAREPDEAGRLTVNTLAFQIPLGLAFCALALFCLPLIDSHPVVRELGLLISFSTMLGILSSTCTAALGGFQNIRTPAFLGLAGSAVGAILVVVSVILNLGVLAIAASGLSSQVLGFLVLLIYTQRKIHMRPRISLRLWRVIIAGGLPFFGWSLVLLISGQIDIPLLKVLAGSAEIGNAEVGWYALATRIMGIPVFLPSIIITAILPALSYERTADSPHFRELASRSIRLVALVNIPACVGTILLAKYLPTLLYHQKSFDEISPLIIILAVNMPLTALDMVLGTVLIALGRQKAWTVVGVVASAMNVLVNLWAIPFTQHLFGDGAIGASITTVLTEAVMFAGALILRPHSIFTRWDLWYIVRCLLAAGVMVPAVWALSSLPVFAARGPVGVVIAVAYGIVIYAMAAYTLQVIRNSDIYGIISVVGAKMGVGEISTASFRHILNRLQNDAASSTAKMVYASVTISRPLIRAGAVISQPLAARTRATVTSRPLHALAQNGANSFLAAEHPDVGSDIYGFIPSQRSGFSDDTPNMPMASPWEDDPQLLDIAQLTTRTLPAFQHAAEPGQAPATAPNANTTTYDTSATPSRVPIDGNETFDEEEAYQTRPVPVVTQIDAATVPTVPVPAVVFTEEDKRSTLRVRTVRHDEAHSNGNTRDKKRSTNPPMEKPHGRTSRRRRARI